MLSVRPLRSTGITPLLRYYGPLRLPLRFACRLCLPLGVLPLGGPPRFLCQIHLALIFRRTPSPSTPESPTNAFTRYFSVGGRLPHLGQAGRSHSGVTRPNRVRLRYGSHVRRTRLRAADCSDNALVWLPVERVIHRVNSFQFTRSARLGLAHPRPPRKTIMKPQIQMYPDKTKIHIISSQL